MTLFENQVRALAFSCACLAESICFLHQIYENIDVSFGDEQWRVVGHEMVVEGWVLNYSVDSSMRETLEPIRGANRLHQPGRFVAHDLKDKDGL